MNNPCRLLLDIAVDKEAYTEKDERYTQKLTHVQDHILLETDLRFLDELYKEAHAETSDEESSDEEASVKLVEAEFIHKYLEHSEKEIAQSLIKLRRMLRQSLATELENETPWKVCNISINF
jgi:hypothetical protein